MSVLRLSKVLEIFAWMHCINSKPLDASSGPAPGCAVAAPAVSGWSCRWLRSRKLLNLVRCIDCTASQMIFFDSHFFALRFAVGSQCPKFGSQTAMRYRVNYSLECDLGVQFSFIEHFPFRVLSWCHDLASLFGILNLLFCEFVVLHPSSVSERSPFFVCGTFTFCTLCPIWSFLLPESLFLIRCFTDPCVCEVSSSVLLIMVSVACPFILFFTLIFLLFFFKFFYFFVEKSFQKTQKWSWVYSENRAKTFRRLRHHRFYFFISVHSLLPLFPVVVCKTHCFWPYDQSRVNQRLVAQVEQLF